MASTDGHGPYYDIPSTPKIDFSKPIDSSVVKGKTALITGGASGIGLAIATALAEAGALVSLCDLDVTAGKKAEESLTSAGYRAKFIETDVASWDSQLLAFKSTLAWSNNALDIVMPCAGIGATTFAEYTAPADHTPGADPPKPPTKCFDVNLTGQYYTTHLACFYFPQLRSQLQGDGFRPQLLMVASLAGYGGYPSMIDYCGSKFGVRGIFKALKTGHKNAGGDVQINLIAPTFLHTNMTKDAASALEAAGARFGTVADSTAACLRCICDPEVDGRAVCVSVSANEPGDMNFDLCDDLPDGDGTAVLFERVKKGEFGTLMHSTGPLKEF